MPILYESTDRAMRQLGQKLKLGLGTDTALFLGGVVVGLIVLPIAVPIFGYQLTKRYGPPPPPPR